MHFPAISGITVVGQGDRVDARQASLKAALPDAPGTDVAGWYRQYHKRLLKYLRGSLRTESDAQDLSQEVFLRLLRLPEERVIEHPRAYLFRVAANVLSDWRAGRKPSTHCPTKTPSPCRRRTARMTTMIAASGRSRYSVNRNSGLEAIFADHAGVLWQGQGEGGGPRWRNRLVGNSNHLSRRRSNLAFVPVRY